MSVWIVDSSPLIFLAGLNRLDLPEVIALALERGAARVVLDDLDARRLADRLGLKPVGTLGLLLAAKLRGEIPSLREEIGQLRLNGFRVAPLLVEAVLRDAGEEESL